MRWRKVAGDLRAGRGKIAAILLVLVLGIASVVAGLDAQAVLEREIAASFRAAAAPDIALWFDRADDERERFVAAQSGVAGVGARRIAFARVAAADGTWLPMRITVLPAFAAQKTGTLHMHGGAWPVDAGSILVEQSGRSLVEAEPGALLRLRKPDGDMVALPVAGWVHDTAVAPSSQERLLYGYVTPAMAELLGQNPHPDVLMVRMERRTSESDVHEFGTAIVERLARTGIPATRMDVLSAAHPHQGLMGALLKVIGVLTLLAFLASAALAAHMITAWMRSEARSVGVMKTLGARTPQIAMQYLALIAPVSLLGITLALPMGAVLGRLLAAYCAVSLNIDIADAQAPHGLLWKEILVALCIPLLATALPIWRSARTTPGATLRDAGIVPLPAAGRLAARLVRIPGHVRWTLASRNIWRRPWRLGVMLVGLAAGGALLLMTFSNYESLMRVIDASLAGQGHDIEVLMQRPAPSAQLEAIARKVPGVVVAEAWRRASVSVSRDAGVDRPPEAKRLVLTAYPDATQLFHAPVVQGRLPQAHAREALVTRATQAALPWLQIDREIEVQYGTQTAAVVRLVGVVEEIAATGMYADFQTFDAVTGLRDLSSSLRVKTLGEPIELTVRALDQAYLGAHLAPAQIVSRAMVRDALDEHFEVVGGVMRMLALAAALIGALILAATTSLNVLERLREAGVLRTLGATPWNITAMFLAEGAVIALLGLLLSVALSVPLTLATLYAAEHNLLYVAVPMNFSWSGLLLLCTGAVPVMLAVLLAVRIGFRASVSGNLAST